MKCRRTDWNQDMNKNLVAFRWLLLACVPVLIPFSGLILVLLSENLFCAYTSREGFCEQWISVDGFWQNELVASAIVGSIPVVSVLTAFIVAPAFKVAASAAVLSLVSGAIFLIFLRDIDLAEMNWQVLASFALALVTWVILSFRQKKVYFRNSPSSQTTVL